MKQWEYMLVNPMIELEWSGDSPIMKTLNNLGWEGWEIVTAWQGNGVKILLKRELYP